ncbi:MAG: hypothetical protein ABI703_08920, partial [Gemmatimonadales bacterium]
MSSNPNLKVASSYRPSATPIEYENDRHPSLVPEELIPPVARVEPRVHDLHGETRIDDYFWLRDRNDPEVLAYLEAENRYTG